MRKLIILCALFCFITNSFSQLNIGTSVNFVKTQNQFNTIKEEFTPYGLYMGYEFKNFSINTLISNNELKMADSSKFNHLNIPLIINTKHFIPEQPVCFNAGLVFNNVLVEQFDKNLNKIKNSYIWGIGYNLSISYKIKNRRFEIGGSSIFDSNNNYASRYFAYISYQFVLFNKVNN